VVELIDDSALRARIYIPEFAMHDIRVGVPVRLRVQSRLLPVTGILRSISADWAPFDPSFGQREHRECSNLASSRWGERRVISMNNLLFAFIFLILRG